jgi:MSHA biogenesis protein MshK
MMIFNQKILLWKQCISYVFAVGNILCIPISNADNLKDPTAPPISLNTTSPADDELTPVPILQSIMIGPQTHAAIINGEKVLLGQKYQAATLIKLNENEVVLRHPDMSTQTLSMDFAVKKKLVTPFMDDTKGLQKVKPHFKPNTKPIEVSEK